MLNQRNRAASQAPLPPLKQASRRGAAAWHHLPAIAKCIVIVALTMALLGVEIELHLRPQLDVLLTAGGVLGLWAWLRSDR